MFDSTPDIAITLRTPDVDKQVTVKFPTDEQWAARASRQKVITQSLGRGKSINKVINSEEVNSTLFSAIKIEGDELDAYEAGEVIERLSRCNVLSADREGRGFVVAMTVPGGEVKHSLKRPSLKQVHDYRDAVANVIDGRRSQEFRMNLYASQELYDAILIGAEGYVSSVPIIHKGAAIAELLSVIDAEKDDSDVQGF